MKTRLVSILSIVLPIAALFSSGCTTDPVYDSRSVTVSVVDLPPIDAATGQYQLWFSYPEDGTSGKANRVLHGDAHFVKMGSFVVNEQGAIAAPDGGPASFQIPEGYNPNLLEDALLTVEPPGTVSDTPGPRLLSGPFTGNDAKGYASLALNGMDAFGSALDTMSLFGAIRLLTPSTLESDDEEMGIWFVDGVGFPSLTLPELPVTDDNPGWIYEAWLFDSTGGERHYTSLGQFRNPQLQDLNGAGPNAGPETVSVRAPGEDFVSGDTRMLNDGSYGVIVSLQPETPRLQVPFHSLLVLYQIPEGTTAFSPVGLAIAPGDPLVSVEVDR